ncbi:MAG: DnaA/Hda family protein [Planctomycetaceae bacterium]
MGNRHSPTQQSATRGPAAFLVLRENQFAYEGLEQLLNPGCPAHGLYIYGPSGVGKSHLIQQFLTKYRIQRCGAAQTVTGSEFAAQIAAAADAEDLATLQKHYREQDLLVVEDIQALRRRPETQRQLVCIVDAIQQRGGVWVCSASDVPGTLSGLHARLVNRLRSGIVAGVQMPGVTSRFRLLSHLAQTAQFPIPIGILRYLAERVDRCPRELIAVLLQLEDLAARSPRGSLDRSTVQRWLERDPDSPQPTLAQITRQVAQHFELTVREMRSQGREQVVALARHCAMFLARELTASPLTDIAGYFGRKNHTTVSYACRQIRQRAATTPALRSRLAQICVALGVTPISCA